MNTLMSKFFILSLVLYGPFTCLGADSLLVRNNYVVCITLPKGGTHLLIKAISGFGRPALHQPYKVDMKNVTAFDGFYDKVNKFDPPHHFKGRLHVPTVGPLPINFLNWMKRSPKRLFWYHWPYTPESEAVFNEHSSINFFIIRDPRDMLISMAHMVKDGRKPGQNAKLEDIIFDFIDGRQKNFIRWGVTIHEAYPLIWELGVTGFYRLYTPWMKAKKFHTIKFEDLVGSKGGGSDDKQRRVLTTLSNKLNLRLPPNKIREVQRNLFGGSGTFREGKISGWKKHFTPEMKEAYKKAPGACQLLIELGYEKDDQW